MKKIFIITALILHVIFISSCIREDAETLSDNIETKSVETTKELTKETIAEETQSTFDILKEASPVWDEYQTDITYEMLARTPDTHIAKYVKFTGTVLQIMTYEDEIDYRIAINDNYDEVILMAHDLDLLNFNLLENDTVDFWGVSCGTTTYETIFGATVSLPVVYSFKVELVKND